ncbi:MAG: hypothetical protein ACYTG3_19875 [Planctomycetota bacterium]
MNLVFRAAVPAGLLTLIVLVGSRTGLAQDAGHRAGQDLWRSCSACHCVPDRRIPQDEDWLKLNETTTCISGEKDTPEARKALIAYLCSKETMRPLLIDDQHAPPEGMTRGRIRVPSTAGSAYLKAERKSVRAGSPPKVRLRWGASEKGTTLAVPAGEFRVISYSFYRLDEKERPWTVSGTSAEGCTQLIISSDKDAAFDLLPEIQAQLSCKADEDSHVLGFFMANRKGKRMSLSREGTLVNPTWIITGAAGERIDAGDFEVT